jgi:hypothetical protein
MAADKVKAKIQELVPSKLWRYTCDHCPCGLVIEESPSLAVVLRAIEQNTIVYGDLPVKMQLLNVQKKYGEVAGHWNLAHDVYDDQSEECKQFIGSLLGV